MNRKLVLVLTLTLLVGMLTVAFNVQRVKAGGTIYIRADGSIDPPTANIATFDNVTYTLTGNINDSIVVERDNIVVDGAGYAVTGSGSVSSAGITLTDRSNVTVRNMTIKNFGFGIYLYSSSDNVLSGNNVTNNQYGIKLGSSSNSTLSGNVMGGNRYNFGVDGYALSDYLHLVDASNLVDGRPVYYFVNQSDMVVDADAYPEVGYLGFVNCANVTVQGLNLTNNREGLLLAFTNDSKIIGNNVANTVIGVWLSSSSDSVLSGNNVANNYEGICLSYSSDNNVLSGNNVTNNQYGIKLTWSSNDNVLSGNIVTNNYQGVWLSSSSDSVLSGNNVTANNGDGIELASSSNNTLSGNNVTANHGHGILLFSSSNNTLSSNSVTNNGRGIELDVLSGHNVLSSNNVANTVIGIWVSSSSNNNVLSGNNVTSNSQYGVYFTDSSNNSVFHNSFVNNTRQVYTQSSNNIWDNGYPSGGNYWSNYTGVDTDDDGIGDTAHTIDANNTDRYPLMGMFSDFDAALEQGVQTICNSSISGFKSNVTSISFNVTGQDGTAGFCRICIPTALMNATYRVFVNGTEVQHNLLPCSNSTHSYLYFTYSHSTKDIVIIPELASLIILPLFMIATLLAVIVYKRKTKISDVM